jgi:hypothetical protein
MQGFRLLALLLQPPLVITTRNSNFIKFYKLLEKERKKEREEKATTFVEELFSSNYLMHGDNLYKANKTNHLLETEWHSSYHNYHYIPAQKCMLPKAFLLSIMCLYLLL